MTIILCVTCTEIGHGENMPFIYTEALGFCDFKVALVLEHKHANFC